MDTNTTISRANVAKKILLTLVLFVIIILAIGRPSDTGNFTVECEDKKVTITKDTALPVDVTPRCEITSTSADSIIPTLHFLVYTAPKHGTLYGLLEGADGKNSQTPTVSYYPDPAYSGEDSFVLQVRDSSGSEQVLVNIDISVEFAPEPEPTTVSSSSTTSTTSTTTIPTTISITTTVSTSSLSSTISSSTVSTTSISSTVTSLTTISTTATSTVSTSTISTITTTA